MHYWFEFRPYRRQFVRSLRTHHGSWDIREGIILRLTDEKGQIGWGEIAPLPWFGSETVEEALNFCGQLPREIRLETIFSIPPVLPACQFGFESAWEAVREKVDSPPYSPAPLLSYSSLLPAGAEALQAWETLWNQGYRTFKWKIGVTAIEDELKVFSQLMQAKPAEAKLRLDANGGLTWDEAKEWLRVCDATCRTGVEFLEQPLAVDRFDAMRE
ncbi:MAG: hypothetical protein NVS2B14_17620 [Chamaesiphon sp.]